jgi:uncharacterized protein (DUF58 family)
VAVELALAARRRVSMVVLEEAIPAGLGSTVRVPVAALAPGGEAAFPYRFAPRLRGVYQVGPLRATWTDPFGLTRRTQTLIPATDIIVHPRVEPVHDRVLFREWEDPPVRPPHTKPWPTGFEFYGMREYVAGDDPRRIVWRQTAKFMDFDEPMNTRYLVRESEQGITDRVLLYLDTDRAGHSPGTPSETFETAVRAVASLATKHAKDGFAVTIEANGGTLVEEARGSGSRVRMMDALAAVELEAAPASDGLRRIVFDARRQTHLVIVTPHLDNESSVAVRLLTDRGVSVLLAMVLWDGSDPLSLHRAATLRCNVTELYASSPLEAAFGRVMASGLNVGSR